MRRFFLMICATAALAACGGGEAPVQQQPVDLNPGGEGDLLPEVQPEVVDERVRRRVDIDQLKASLARVSDGRVWTDPVSGNDLLDQLAATLGKPDYAQLTSEDLTASPLFMKFLGDAARQICDSMAEDERTMSAADRVLYPHVEPGDTLDSSRQAVLQNLSELLLRYHGRSLAPDAEALNPWVWLFESATFVTDDPVKGWRTVCVGLITHPDFYSY